MRKPSVMLLLWRRIGARCRLAMLLVFLLGGLAGHRGQAQVVDWGVATGNWNVGSNWTGGSVPTASGTATIDNARVVLLGPGVTGTASSVFVGNYGSGTMNLSGGQLTATTSIVGNNQGSNGTATISSGTWANSGTLTLGNSGTGTLTVNGGLVTNGAGFLGRNSGSRGTATVSSGTWTLGGPLAVGNAGSGSLAAAAISGGSGTATVNFNHSDDVTSSIPLSGTFAVRQIGSGATILSGSNTYSGTTTVTAG